MKSRKDMMDSASSSDEESSKSTDDESPSKKRSRSHSSSSNSDSDNEQRAAKKPKRRVTHSLSEDSDNSDDEKNGGEKVVATGSQQQPTVSEPMEEDKSDLEEGQISSDEDDDGDSESSSNSEFDDGYGEDLMGNEEDRNALEKLSEKERETELFKRAERRDQLKRRWEIERKLKQSRRNENAAKKKDKKPKNKKPVKTAAARKMIDKPPPKVSMPAPPISRDEAITQLLGKQSEESSPNDYAKEADDYFDAKERSKERKKNVEMNKTDDKRSNAMAMLKARREGKQKRDFERNEAAKQAEDEKEELSGVGEKSSTKLTTSDVYSSDDSDSDSGEKPSDRRSTSSRSSSSDSEDDESQATVYKKPVYVSTLKHMNDLRISRHKLERFINLPIFDKTIVGCFIRINIGNNAQTGKIVYRVAEIMEVVEGPKIYSFGTGRTNKGLRLKHATQERIFRMEFASNQDFTQSEFDAWKDACEKNHVDLPTVDKIAQKKKDIEHAANYTFKEEDIDKIIEEKNRFRSHPTNYAMRKTQLMKDRDAAINAGDEELANEIGQKIHELEERANELDKKRTSSISLISYINDRNRRKNVEEAEKAIREEARLNKGLKMSDPFTRRSTKPTMTFKQKAATEQEEIIMMPEPPKPNKKPEKKIEEHASGDKLYELHDFDIDLDIDSSSTLVAPAIPKPVEKTQDTAPKIRRSLNLEDYKKKRGLI